MKVSEVSLRTYLMQNFLDRISKRERGEKIMKKLRTLLQLLSVILLLAISAQAQERQTPYIYALYNPVVIAPGQTSGTVTLVWDGGKNHPYAEVWVRVDQNDETFIVEQGKGTRNSTVQLGRSYEFQTI